MLLAHGMKHLQARRTAEGVDYELAMGGCITKGADAGPRPRFGKPVAQSARIGTMALWLVELGGVAGAQHNSMPKLDELETECLTHDAST